MYNDSSIKSTGRTNTVENNSVLNDTKFKFTWSNTLLP